MRYETSSPTRHRSEGAAHLVLPRNVSFIDQHEAVFEAMIAGWIKQQTSRQLKNDTINQRIRTLKRFREHADNFPWVWKPATLEDFVAELTTRRVSVSTIRLHQGAIRLFLEFVTDRRYGWVQECERRFGTSPSQICHEWNTVQHRDEYEGQPTRRPLTFDELQALFDFADSRVESIRALKRKGSLSAFRDATMFKVQYAWAFAAAK
jgi:integrase/recombinase XerC